MNGQSMKWVGIIVLCWTGNAAGQPGRPYMPPSPPPIIQIQRQQDQIQQQNWRIQDSLAANRNVPNYGSSVAPEDAALLKKVRPRVFIAEIQKGGQADRLGLKKGDGLLTFAGQTVTSIHQYAGLRETENVGDPSRPLLVVRNGAVVAAQVAPGLMNWRLR